MSDREAGQGSCNLFQRVELAVVIKLELLPIAVSKVGRQMLGKAD